MRVFSHLWLFIGCWCLVNSKNNSGNQLNRNNTRGVIRHQQTFDTKLNHLVVDNVADRVSANELSFGTLMSVIQPLYVLCSLCHNIVLQQCLFFPYYTLQTLLNVLELLVHADSSLVVISFLRSQLSEREKWNNFQVSTSRGRTTEDIYLFWPELETESVVAMGLKCGRVIKYSFRSWELIINFPLSLARSVVLFFLFYTLPRFSTMSMSMKFVWVNFRVFPPSTIHSLLGELCSVVLVGWLWWTAKARATTNFSFYYWNDDA